MFEWDDARHFLAIHRTGSLTAAARQLGVNQSTVGRRLLALEEKLGAKLFFRTRDGHRIAPAGERLLPHAERMEDEAIAIAREIAGQETTLTGHVRVTSPEGFGARVVAPLLARFRARYPGISLDTNNRLRLLSRREADIAVRVGGSAESGVVVRKVGAIANAPYASEAYIAARGRPRPPWFEGHDLIGYDDALSKTPEYRWMEERTTRGARIAFRAESTAAQVRIALEGAGVALLPYYVGEAEPELVRIAPPAQFVMQSVWIVIHRDLRGAARIRACADYLAEGLKAQAAFLEGKAPAPGRHA